MPITLSGGSGITFPDSTVQSTTATTTIGALRAWVNFNGTGTVAIRASGNVTSITDNGNGQYTINFATAMPDANYGTCISGGYQPGVDARLITVINSDVAQTTSGFRITSALATTGAATDSDRYGVAVFR